MSVSHTLRLAWRGKWAEPLDVGGAPAALGVAGSPWRVLSLVPCGSARGTGSAPPEGPWLRLRCSLLTPRENQEAGSPPCPLALRHAENVSEYLF